MKPRRASIFLSAGIASSRLPRMTSTCGISSGTLARTFSRCGGMKWIIRSSRTGSSRKGCGAPTASGWKKRRGSFIEISVERPRTAAAPPDKGEGGVLQLQRLAESPRNKPRSVSRIAVPEPAMSDLVGLFNLLAPFFGLIALGFLCGKVVTRPEGGPRLDAVLPDLRRAALPVLPADRRQAAGPAGQLALHRGHDAVHLLRLRALVRGRASGTRVATCRKR